MKIDPSQHGWMTAPETVQVMAALGGGRFVGGPRRSKCPFHGVVVARSVFPGILSDKKIKRRRRAY
jgi:hypothetical protein